ncbi:glycoside hydrolase family protein [sulfur-oxidizing endosymbiont of Gigantopelta aegis]|uniref:glycoside hydrolase family protein n=1 Tax=sulfur-oxidizing endosymbiont of Gigantopelta aegis TaxID=2794934 RepID=UPI0018DC8388|nr:glycoside hydrolase family protein [sulfur-oxidizing endosymbiont of Gigantopelta aegis]
MPRKINQAGLKLIKKFEGLRLTCYDDSVGVATIGYGHTRTVKRSDIGKKTITEAEAEELLKADVASSEQAVERYISIKLDDNQFAALVCFTFNLGAGSLKSSTLRRKLNAGDYNSVPSELARWVKAGGKTLAGLVKRRTAEGELFMSSVKLDIEAHVPRRADNPNNDDRLSAYLIDDSVELERGSVDDIGAEKYLHLNQNVPDNYVTALQHDFNELGYSASKADGAFGKNTRTTVIDFQKSANINVSGIVDSLTKDAIILWLKEGYSKINPPKTDKPLDEHQPGVKQLIFPPVTHFSQGDPRWGSRLLGRSSSISKQGCAISSIAMLLDFYGRKVNPGQLDDYLDNNNGYSGNSVIWGVAGQFNESHEKKLKYHRETGSSQKLVKIIKERIKKNLPTMARVDYGTDADLTYNHFVVCVGIATDGDIIMNDPATHRGNGYVDSGNENIIQKTTRKNSYTIVGLDYYEPVN